MKTMQDIAEKAGVSAATVSRVLNNKSASIPISAKTREKVLAIAKEMGYRPNLFAKSLRTKKTYLIGVIVWDLTDPFFSEILRGIDQVLDQSGYNLLLSNAEGNIDREKSCLEKMRNFRVDGMLIVGGAKSFCEEHIEKIGLNTHNLVLVGTKSECMDLSSITVDNLTGGFMGAEYLIKKNRPRLFYIAGREKTIDMEERLEGVKKAVAQYGIEERFYLYEEGPGEQEGYAVTKRILENSRPPLSIFAATDITALGVIRAVKDRKLRIPEEVAVLGFDDLSMAGYLEPRLSTVHQPRLQMGKSGAGLLVKLIEKGDEAPQGKVENRVLGPKLVMREST